MFPLQEIEAFEVHLRANQQSNTWFEGVRSKVASGSPDGRGFLTVGTVSLIVLLYSLLRLAKSGLDQLKLKQEMDALSERLSVIDDLEKEGVPRDVATRLVRLLLQEIRSSTANDEVLSWISSFYSSQAAV